MATAQQLYAFELKGETASRRSTAEVEMIQSISFGQASGWMSVNRRIISSAWVSI